MNPGSLFFDRNMKSNSAILLHGTLLLLLVTMGASLWFLLPTRESMNQATLTSADSTSQSRVTGPVRDSSAHWRAELARVDRELQSWREKKRQIAAELTESVSTEENPSPPTADVEDVHKLAGILIRRRAELESIQLTSDVVQPNTEQMFPIGHRSEIRRKEPVWLQLYGNRVLPIDERYYSVRTIDAAGNAFRVLRRTSAGETYREATTSGSKFQLMLASVDQEKQYLQCLVSEDSFDILRTIIHLASEKGIDVAWDPFKDEDGRVVFTPRQTGGMSLPQ
jgi:hypothetical protein